MLHKPQRILIITSVSPSKDGPGKLSLNAFNALKKEGYSVDLLTKYSVKDYPDILYIYKKKNIFNLLREKIISFCIRKQKKGYYFFYKKEIYPPVPINDVLKAITNSYDLVFIQFWQGLLTFETIKAIHDKLHCQIQPQRPFQLGSRPFRHYTLR